MAFSVTDLLAILELEQIEENIFRGRSPQIGWQRIFGGLVIAQAMVAAARTVPDRPPHSLHGYFILPGDPSAPIIFEVDRLRDGKSFSTRQCVAIQHGRPIFSLSASFQVEEPGLDHQIEMPDVPPPESLPSEADIMALNPSTLPEGIKRYFDRERPVELRPVDLSRYLPVAGAEPRSPKQHIWMRASQPLPDDPSIHRAFLAYLSDMTLLDTSLVVHNRSLFDGGLQVASLDHSLWFHRAFRADQWLLYAQDSPSSSGARGLTRGLIYTREGTLVATVAQEGLIRVRAG
ncbi:acyl-CoA thioesterase II [Lichenihabitans psoromatis]|uniref:acyl-CoA thioesterase II n=1 Tax=Lichenihabitans psoromatis TaxID=2528642 RepID=UPI0010383A33|nr:acyl-CoA thioesterase II [Lichenihabitans psoromatis]